MDIGSVSSPFTATRFSNELMRSRSCASILGCSAVAGTRAGAGAGMAESSWIAEHQRCNRLNNIIYVVNGGGTLRDHPHFPTYAAISSDLVVNLLLFFFYIYLFVYYCCNCVSETINFLVYHPPSSHEMITSIFGCVMCLLLLSVSDI